MQLGPLAHQVLDRIASGESHGYTDLFGGRKFHSFADHPDIPVPVGDGMFTTAAGRYQMLKGTWDNQKQRLGLKDFSPESQDLAAWDLAQRTYQQQTGRPLEADASKGAVNWGALSNQWTSLKGPIRTAAAAAGPGATALPVNLSPVPGNLLELPSSSAPDAPLVTAVEHNPFQSKAALVPVDFNPFQPVSTTP